MYNSWEALPLIYECERMAVGDEEGGPISLTQARTNESVTKAKLNQIQIESLEKTRIPIEVVNEAMDASLGEVKAIIEKSAIPDEEKKLMRDELSSIPERLKW